jgi:hypothetical protein
VLLALPLLHLVGGCHSLARDIVAIEYQPGTAPTTIAAKCDAVYRLSAPEKREGRPGYQVAKGETVGFRREPDGSLVAVAAGHTLALEETRYVWVWEYTPKPTTPWERFLVKTRDRGEKAAETAVYVLFLPPFLIRQALFGPELP